jgi:hypothetical protein
MSVLQARVVTITNPVASEFSVVTAGACLNAFLAAFGSAFARGFFGLVFGSTADVFGLAPSLVDFFCFLSGGGAVLVAVSSLVALRFLAGLLGAVLLAALRVLAGLLGGLLGAMASV